MHYFVYYWRLRLAPNRLISIWICVNWISSRLADWCLCVLTLTVYLACLPTQLGCTRKERDCVISHINRGCTFPGHLASTWTCFPYTWMVSWLYGFYYSLVCSFLYVELLCGDRLCVPKDVTVIWCLILTLHHLLQYHLWKRWTVQILTCQKCLSTYHTIHKQSFWLGIVSNLKMYQTFQESKDFSTWICHPTISTHLKTAD